MASAGVLRSPTLLERRRKSSSLSLNSLSIETSTGSDSAVLLSRSAAASLAAESKQSPISKEVAEKYSDVERLAEGGLGVVYKAVHRSSGSHVALKVVRAADDHMVASGRAEFHLLQELKHPSIISAVDFMVSGTRTIMVMNLFAGSELGNAVSHQHNNRFTEIVSTNLFRCLMDALAHLHKHQIVHRDVKPENVLVSDDLTTLQLIDFSVAQYLPENGVLSPRCSPAYASPEVRRGGSPSEAADIWGAGLCLMMMLSGSCHIQNGKVDISKCEATERCKAVLFSCLMIDETLRPTAQDVLKTLRLSGVHTADEPCTSSKRNPSPHAPRSCSPSKMRRHGVCSQPEGSLNTSCAVTRVNSRSPERPRSSSGNGIYDEIVEINRSSAANMQSKYSSVKCDFSETAGSKLKAPQLALPDFAKGTGDSRESLSCRKQSSSGCLSTSEHGTMLVC